MVFLLGPVVSPLQPIRGKNTDVKSLANERRRLLKQKWCSLYGEAELLQTNVFHVLKNCKSRVSITFISNAVWLGFILFIVTFAFFAPTNATLS